MRTVRRSVACAALVVLISCEPGGEVGFTPRVPLVSPTSANSRVVALVGTLSGPGSESGNDAFEAAQAAVAVLNASLDERERPFELVTLDDGGSAREAQALIEQVVTTYQTVGIVFSGPPQALPASEHVLASAGVPALLQVGDLFSDDLLSPHVFQVSPPYVWQATSIADYVFEDRGYKRVGALTSEGASGQAARRSLNVAFSRAGHRLEASELLRPGGTGLASALDRLKAKRIQAVVLEGPPRDEAKVLAALEDAGDVYSNRQSAKTAPKGSPGADGDYWGPQIVGFDTLIAPDVGPLAAGSVAVDTYARGAHYLPVPSFEEFREAFSDWWGNRVPPPLGQELRAFESVLALGWAARQVPSSGDVDLATVLETLRGKRFGGLDVTFSSQDHLAPEEPTLGMWTVPSSADDIPNDDHPPSLPWVPLDRTFTIDGRHTAIVRQDWRYLFGLAHMGQGRPVYPESRFGITTPSGDPIH